MLSPSSRVEQATGDLRGRALGLGAPKCPEKCETGCQKKRLDFFDTFCKLFLRNSLRSDAACMSASIELLKSPHILLQDDKRTRRDGDVPLIFVRKQMVLFSLFLIENLKEKPNCTEV